MTSFLKKRSNKLFASFIAIALLFSPLAHAGQPPAAAAAQAVINKLLGQPSGLPTLNVDGYLDRDPAGRAPTQRDDNRCCHHGDGTTTSLSNVQDYGSLWGWPTPTGYREFQMRWDGSQTADWQPVNVGDVLDLSGTSGVTPYFGCSPYQLRAGLTGTGFVYGNLYRITGTGAYATMALTTPLLPGNEASAAGVDAFMFGSTALNPTYFICNDQSTANSGAGNPVTSDWGLPSGNTAAVMTLQTVTGTGNISGTTFTAATPTSGSWQPGDQITGGTVPAGTFIVSGTQPTFTINQSATVTGSPTLTGLGTGYGGTTGTLKSVTLNGTGCNGTLVTAPVLKVTVSGTYGQAATTPMNVNNQGVCAGATGPMNTIQGSTGDGFTVGPVFQIVSVPIYAPFLTTSPVVNGDRAMSFNTWPANDGTVFPAMNRVLRVGTQSFDPINYFVMLAGISTNSASPGLRPLISTRDGNYGLSTANGNNGTIGSIAAVGSRCYNGYRAVPMQAANPNVMIVNLNAGSAWCRDNNEVVQAGTWSGEAAATGFMIGAPSTSSLVSWQGDAVAIVAGTNASSAAGFADLNTVYLAAAKLIQDTPQAGVGVHIVGGSLSYDQGNASTNSWYRQAENSIRSSTGNSIATTSYNFAVAGQTFASFLGAFYNNGGDAMYYYQGCDTMAVCFKQEIGDKNDWDKLCAGVSGPNCTSTVTASQSGTTLTLTGEVVMGTVLTGGGITGSETITGYQGNATGFGGNYTVNQSATFSSTTLNTSQTPLQVAQAMAALKKTFVYWSHQLGAGRYAVNATLPSTTGISGVNAGDSAYLVPPAGSGASCVYPFNGTMQANPVVTFTHVTAGVPDRLLITHDNRGACQNWSTTAPLTMAGWTAVNVVGTGTWGSATFTVTTVPETVPTVVIGTIPLQNSTFSSAQEMLVVPIENADVETPGLATALQPVPCVTVTTCLTLGTGYGADDLNDMFSDQITGAGVYTYTPFADPNCSGDGEHWTEYCQMAASLNFGQVLNRHIPFY